MAQKLIKSILLISLGLFVLSHFLKGHLPEQDHLRRELYSAPRMSQTGKATFKIERKGIEYTIKPLYDYELYGLIVADHSNIHFLDYYHKQWQDFLNIKDICVIWGDNLKNLDYQRVRFSTGSFTWRANAPCEVWRKFKYNCLSYNHLLLGSEEVAQAVKKAKRGDQIHMRGYLAEYSHSGGKFVRSSSTTLEDREGGSCETVYVTEFEILSSSDDFWGDIHQVSKWAIGGCLIAWALVWFKAPVNIYRT